MTTEKFCLRWNDFERNISSAFQELRVDNDLFDITLVCKDEEIRAHRVIMSACSPFFRNMLKRNPHPNPLIYLKGVSFNDLQSVLTFMYHGEVNISQEDLNSFLAVAEDLQVKGLTQKQQGADRVNNYETSKPPRQRVSEIEPHDKKPMHIIPENTYNNTRTNQKDDNIQDIIMQEKQQQIKSEPGDPSMVYNSAQDSTDHSVVTYQEENIDGYEDYSQYEHHTTGSGKIQESFSLENQDVDIRTPDDLLKFVLPGDSGFICFYCSKAFPNKRDVRNHLESIHFPNYFTYSCEICGKEFKSLNSRNIHMTRSHNKAKKAHVMY